MADWWYDARRKDEADRRIAELCEWELENQIWFDGTQDTGFTAVVIEDDSWHWRRYEKFTPTESRDQALDAAFRIADRKGAIFRLERSESTFAASFGYRGNPRDCVSRNPDEVRAICEAITAFGDLLFKRSQPDRIRGRRRGRRSRGRGSYQRGRNNTYHAG